MNPAALARRPRFLGDVPTSAVAQPPRFAAASPQPGLAASRSFAGAVPPSPDLSPRPSGGRGEIDGVAAAAEDARREALQRVATALETLRAHAERLAQAARSDAIEIGFQVASKILELEVRQNPEALFALVRSALRRAGESRRITLRLAPEDAAKLQATSSGTALEGLSAARLEIVRDASLQPGDCVVDTDFGQVDGRIGTRLAEVRRAVGAVCGEVA